MTRDLPDIEMKVSELIDHGMAHRDAGRLKKAEQCFRKALALAPKSHAAINLALLKYESDQYEEVVRLLKPTLTDQMPLEKALVGLSLKALGKTDGIERLLDEALDEIAWICDNVTEFNAIPGLTISDLVVGIQHLMAETQDHERVIRLSQCRGQSTESEQFYLAGIAAFNLGRYGEATDYWAEMDEPALDGVCSAFTFAAQMAQDGRVPAYPMEYELLKMLPPARRVIEEDCVATSGIAKTLLLWHSLSPTKTGLKPAQQDSSSTSDMPESLLVQLIMLSGKWGVAFARNLIQSEWATIGQKISAVSALVGLGELPGGRSVEIIHNNRPMSILASKPSVSRACEDVGTLLDRAVELHKQGHDREVCDIITELIKIGVDHPPVMTMLARSLTNLGREREAQLVIEQMEDEHPGDPMVYLNLSAFYLENGDIANALSYFELLKECDVPSELSELVADVEEAIAAQLHSLIVSQKIEADYCGEKDNLDISLNLTLRQALKHIPVDWLNAIASQYKLEPVPRRREREKALACKMLVPESLIRALREERAEVRKALAQILASGGHHDSSALIERYGSIDDDGFYWVDKPPKSVIGRLRLLGFVYIGRAVLDAEERQVAVVPVDLRKMLSRILT